MKTILLSNSPESLIVDDEDYDRLVNYTWSLKAKRGDGVITVIRIHRCYRNIPIANMVMQNRTTQYDHRDRNPLNNCKDNLREASQAQNVYNRSKLNADVTSSKYKGVTWKRKNKQWCAQIGYKHQRFHLGLFASQEEAARAYNAKAKEFFREFAALNVL